MEAGSKAEPWLIQTGYYLVENMAMYQFLTWIWNPNSQYLYGLSNHKLRILI